MIETENMIKTENMIESENLIEAKTYNKRYYRTIDMIKTENI